MMVAPILLAACALFLQAIAFFKRWTVASVFVLTAGIYVLFGTLEWAVVAISQTTTTPDVTGASDTYYVVINRHNFLEVGILMLLPALFMWVQHRLNPLIFGRFKWVLFWVINWVVMLGITLRSTLFSFLMPRQYTGYEEFFRLFNSISIWTLNILGCAMIAVILLPVITVFLKGKNGG